jgi:nucleotide-binding universal stress UspA family protein
MYRSILVHADADPGATARIRFAADIARQFDATLIGLAAALPRPPVEAITAGVLDASLVALELEEINAEFKIAEQLFRTLAAEAGVKVEWRAVRAVPTPALAAAASAADLLIVGRAGHAAFGNDYRTVDPGDLLIRAGRPILIAPSEASRLNARTVLVAWKSTREARRAVFDAMPFLKRAEAVNLVEVRESGEANSLQDVAAHLAAHGVKFKAEAVDRDSTGIEDQLIALARRTQSDLIVAGGYGHTRIRELVFGGVTRSLISSCPLPSLLSH